MEVRPTLKFCVGGLLHSSNRLSAWSVIGCEREEMWALEGEREKGER